MRRKLPYQQKHNNVLHFRNISTLYFISTFLILTLLVLFHLSLKINLNWSLELVWKFNFYLVISSNTSIGTVAIFYICRLS